MRPRRAAAGTTAPRQSHAFVYVVDTCPLLMQLHRLRLLLVLMQPPQQALTAAAAAPLNMPLLPVPWGVRVYACTCGLLRAFVYMCVFAHMDVGVCLYVAASRESEVVGKYLTLVDVPVEGGKKGQRQPPRAGAAASAGSTAAAPTTGVVRKPEDTRTVAAGGKVLRQAMGTIVPAAGTVTTKKDEYASVISAYKKPKRTFAFEGW
eukprot:GHVU01041963.1.p2 GENE.GHVU01041963.1~~GHVU01041963.1.p2  ORF type:complete len:206 (-),score=32.37 GHVU01041963.1:459-1076(-)